MSNMVVGLTGGIGVGKTTVTDMFAKFGIEIIDADVIARQVVMPGTTALAEIAKQFGSEVLTDKGELNRPILRSRVFSNENEKNWLNNLLHPLIRKEIQTQLASAASPYCILVAPLLIENALTQLVDHVLIIDLDEQTQRQRAAARDGTSPEEINKIMDNQANRESRLKVADQIILNDGNISQLHKKVEELHQFYQIQQKKDVKP